MHQTKDNASLPPFIAVVTAGVPTSLSHAIESVFDIVLKYNIKSTVTLFLDNQWINKCLNTF